MTELENLIGVSDSTFEERVLDAELPVVVDFWATWCGPCRMMAPAFAELSSEYAGRMLFAKYDLEHPEGREQADRYFAERGIRGIPALVLFKDGAAVADAVGYSGREALAETLAGWEGILKAEGGFPAKAPECLQATYIVGANAPWEDAAALLCSTPAYLGPGTVEAISFVSLAQKFDIGGLLLPEEGESYGHYRSRHLCALWGKERDALKGLPLTGKAFSHLMRGLEFLGVGFPIYEHKATAEGDGNALETVFTVGKKGYTMVVTGTGILAGKAKEIAQGMKAEMEKRGLEAQLLEA